MYKTLLLC